MVNSKVVDGKYWISANNVQVDVKVCPFPHILWAILVSSKQPNMLIKRFVVIQLLQTSNCVPLLNIGIRPTYENMENWKVD